MYRPEARISGVFSVCLRRGHQHCFDLRDPDAAVLRHHLTDPLVEVRTTMGTREDHLPGFDPISGLVLSQDVVEVEVLDVDDDAVLVRWPDATVGRVQ